MSTKPIYEISYRDPQDGEIKTLRAATVRDSSLGLAFVCLSDFVFEKSSLVINPKEEELAKRFENIKSLHLSLYSIVSIAETGAEHAGLKFDRDKSNLVVLPSNEARGADPKGPTP